MLSGRKCSNSCSSRYWQKGKKKKKISHHIKITVLAVFLTISASLLPSFIRAFAYLKSPEMSCQPGLSSLVCPIPWGPGWGAASPWPSQGSAVPWPQRDTFTSTEGRRKGISLLPATPSILVYQPSSAHFSALGTWGWNQGWEGPWKPKKWPGTKCWDQMECGWGNVCLEGHPTFSCLKRSVCERQKKGSDFGVWMLLIMVFASLRNALAGEDKNQINPIPCHW